MAELTEYVNYQNFAPHIQQMRVLGDFIQNNLDCAYKALGSLNEAAGWKGPQYDKLVECFNNMREGFNEILEDVGYKIPNMMNSAAKAWSDVDGGSFASVVVEAIKKIVEIEKSGETALTWNKEKVDATKQNIEDYLQKAVDTIKELATRFRAMNADWKGKDYEDNLEDIKKYQDEVAAKVEELKADFVKYMNESIAAYDKVRSAVSEWK